jgi:PH (Pleckstrin Homology) domain-containing protein
MPVPLPKVFRPLGVRLAVLAFGTALLVTTAAIWFTFPDEVQDQFTPIQRVTVAIMGLGVAAIGFALARCSVRADDGGLTVVNGYVTRHFAWEEVVDVTLRPGNPWAVLDLADGTSQSALGIQGSDGNRAQQQVRELRRLVEAHAGHEPPARPDPDAGDDPVT